MNSEFVQVVKKTNKQKNQKPTLKGILEFCTTKETFRQVCQKEFSAKYPSKGKSSLLGILNL